MHIGISRPPTPPHPTPDIDAAVVARHAEALGFESILYGEHPIRPVDQPGHGVHAHGVPFFQDTLVALARISAATSKIKFGGGVFLIPEHNPVQFAKELASLDFYSGGRLIVGAGIGWSQVECELLGGHWDRRWAQSRESIQIMKLLWSQETVTYNGEFYNLPPVQLYPQPVNGIGPPVLIASLNAADPGGAFARIVEFGDGWIPAFYTDDAVVEGPDIIRKGRATLTQMAQDAGRDPQTLQITAIIRGGQVDGDLGSGLHAVDASLLRRYEDAGVDRALISLPTITSEASAREALERIAELVL